MSKIFIEEAMADLYDYLYRHLNAKLEALRMQYMDNLTLDMFADSSWYLGELPMEVANLPNIVFRAHRHRIEDEWHELIMSRFELEIIVLVGDPENNASNRFRRLARYARGIFETVKDWEDDVGNYMVEWKDPIRYSGAYPVDPFIQGVSIPIQLLRREGI